MARVSTEEFIQRSNAKHDNKYTYDKTVVCGVMTKVIITCPTHGDFEKTPNAHMKGQGCKKCAYEQLRNARRTSVDDFVRQAREIHGDKYTYDDIDSSTFDMRKKVQIKCPSHGTFPVLAVNHVSRKSGCKKCADENLSVLKSKGAEKFIEESKLRFGDAFEYIDIPYKNQKSIVKLRCTYHGVVFDVCANNHLSCESGGCTACTAEHKRRYVISWPEMLQRFQSVHGDKYDYSQVQYVNRQEAITVICKEHGPFPTRAALHELGSGCPICGKWRRVAKICHYLSLMNIKYKTEHWYSDCRRVNPLRFDIYLPDYGHSGALIEHDGVQHTVAVKGFGGEEQLKYIQENDTIKNEYCISKGIPLLRINHDDDLLASLMPFIESFDKFYEDLS